MTTAHTPAQPSFTANRLGRFDATAGDLVVTGPTGTNVNDLKLLLKAG